ncbi:MAG TPA: hypothetical protein VF545_14115, partial [Thermoleophilaceae bacterium]
LPIVGLAEDAPPAPLDPSAAPVDGRAAADLAGVALVALLAWVLLRTPLLRRGAARPDATAPGAGAAVSVVLSLLAVGAWLVNPFAGLALVLPLHCWMLATMTGVRPAARAWLAAVGVLPGLAIAATYMHEMGLGPLDFAWYLFLLVTGGQVGVPLTLIGCALVGILASVATIVVAHALDARRSAAADARSGDSPGRSASGGQWSARATAGQRGGPRA